MIIYLADSVESAKCILKDHILKKADMVLSTHYSVVDYYRLKGILCKDICDFVEQEAVVTYIEDASKILSEKLNRLDAELAESLSSVCGMPLTPIFYTCYKYGWRYILAGNSVLHDIFNNILADTDAEKLYFYYRKEISDHPIFSNIVTLRNLCDRHGIEFGFKRVFLSRTKRSIYSRLIRLLRLARGPFPEEFMNEFVERIALRLKPSKFTAGEKKIAIDFGNRKSFCESLKRQGFEVLSWPRKGIPYVRGIEQPKVQTSLAKIRIILDNWLNQNDWNRQNQTLTSIVRYTRQNDCFIFTSVVFLNHFLRNYDVSLGVWDVPVCNEAPILLTCKRLVNNIPVLGRQHGCCYVDQNTYSKHFESDFNYCTYYISYGFSQKEFSNTYPNHNLKCKILPGGYELGKERSYKNVRNIDLVFPLTSIPGIRSFSDDIKNKFNAQRVILEAMNYRSDLSSFVKPMAGANTENFAHTHYIKRLKVVRRSFLTWEDFIKAYKPKVVISECPSTPIYQCLNINVDIFLLKDPVYKFSELALSMLTKRVYLFDSPEEIRQAILDYQPGKLKPKRNASFYNTFVNRGNFDSAVDQCIKEIDSTQYE